MDRLTQSLQACTPVLPTLQQVKDVEAELKEADPYVPPVSEEKPKLELYTSPPPSESKAAGSEAEGSQAVAAGASQAASDQ